MSIHVHLIIQATSIILITAFFAIYKLRRRRALERELSLYRESKQREIDQEVAKHKNDLFLEQQEKLQEIQLKLKENETIFETQKVQMDKFLEDYKNSRILGIAAELKEQTDKFQVEVAAIKEQKTEELLKMEDELNKSKALIDELQSAQFSILEALRRDALQNEEYHLNLIEQDLSEIEELKSVAARYARIRPIILKAVYDIYYAPEVRKLISRIVGDDKTMGIYRITSLKDGRVYIGKSVDIKSRWTTHFKRAAGIETETQNMLYPEMRRLGLQNFSFEIIEVVKDEKILSDREKYWQEFYKAKEHGFSVR
jgi:hypothetical protein